jgi:uncharacterized protein (TIRG00374 family)
MRRFWQALLVSLGLGVGVLALVLPHTFSSTTLAALGSFNVRYIPLCLLAIALWWLLGALRIILMAAYSGHRLTLWQGVQTHVSGVFSASVTPAGTGNSLGIAWILTRFGLGLERAVAITMLILVADMSLFAWVVPASFFYLLYHGVALPIPHIRLLVAALSLVALATSYLLIFQLKLFTNLLKQLMRMPYLRRFKKRVDTFLDKLEVANRSFATMPWPQQVAFYVLSWLARISSFLLLNLILMAFGVNFSQVAIMAVQLLIHAFAFVVPTPGASGYQEAALSWLLKGQVPAHFLSASIILARLGNFYLYFFLGPLIGGPALLSSTKDTVSSSHRHADS